MASRYPQYIPFYYIVFLIFRKVIRQGLLRHLEAIAKKNPMNLEFCDGPGQWTEKNQLKNTAAINKPAFWINEDLKKPHIAELVNRINTLKALLDSRQLRYCSPAGTFNPNTYLERTEKVKMWENVWLIHHAGVRPGYVVLDLGGASTLFSFYLASIGCSVRVIDNDWGNCGIIYNTNYVGKKMNWDIKAYDLDLDRTLPFKNASFDRVFCVCVLEHLPCEARRFVMKEANRVLKVGGIIGITIDYDSGRDGLLSDKGLRFAYREKIERDIIRPSDLTLFGTCDWTDTDPQSKFLGALFLKK